MKSWEEIRPWRVQLRKRLIEERMAMNPAAREAQGEAVRSRIAAEIDLGAGAIGIYWPIRGEIDLRALARAHIERGGTVGLPVVVEPFAPLEFWRWSPGTPLRHDRAKIPIPAERDPVQPQALLIPLVGYDPDGYRLGYGGGYYDRTLAAARPCPLRVGLGYEEARLQSIHPQPHDIPMDVIVTAGGIRWFERAPSASGPAPGKGAR